MSDWQPARLHNPHKIGDTPDVPLLYRKTVRVRPCAIDDIGLRALMMYRDAGCDARAFFEIDPLDGTDRTFTGCEHEILTD